MGKIVWLASYPKSGNTWVRAFLHNYITCAQTPHSIDALTEFSAVECAAAFFHGPGERLSEIETQRRRPQVHQQLTELHDDLVFVKTHNANLAVAGVPLCTPAETAGAIHIIRDPRDVAVSYSAFTGRSVDEIIDFMGVERAMNPAGGMQVFEFLSSWSVHAESWSRMKRRLILRYEDLLAEPEKHFGRVVQFLGGDAEPERLARAIAFSDFGILAAQERENGYRAKAERAVAPFFRAGRNGAWRDALTTEQMARIEKDHGAMMRKFGYL